MNAAVGTDAAGNGTGSGTEAGRDLPIVVAGTPTWPGDTGATVELETADGLGLRLARLTPAALAAGARAQEEAGRELAELSTFEVTDFLSAVGRRWMAGSPEIDEAMALVPRVTGYAAEMVASDLFMMAEYLRFRTYAYDQLAAELGHELIMDEWVPLQASYVRAFPAGTVLHYLVGNIPLAGLYSLIRATITRNASIAKLASRDPVTPTLFALGCHAVDPDHPVTRAQTVAYWPRGAEEADVAADAADVVVVWGGADAVREIRSGIEGPARIVEFGPRWSAAVVDADHDPTGLSYRLAADVSYYDQEACFSVQRAWVLGDVDGLLAELLPALDRFAERMPASPPLVDARAHRTACLAAADFAGDTVHRGRQWTVVVAPDPASVPEHPLQRTLFVHPVADLDEVGPHIDPLLQTLAVWPWDVAAARRDDWARRGAARIVEVGMTRHPRHGFTHDNMRSLNSLVRLVSHERPMGGRHFYKYGDVHLPTIEENLFVTGSDPQPPAAPQ